MVLFFFFFSLFFTTHNVHSLVAPMLTYIGVSSDGLKDSIYFSRFSAGTLIIDTGEAPLALVGSLTVGPSSTVDVGNANLISVNGNIKVDANGLLLGKICPCKPCTNSFPELQSVIGNIVYRSGGMKALTYIMPKLSYIGGTFSTSSGYGKQTDEAYIELPALQSIGQSSSEAGGFSCGKYMSSHALDRLTVGAKHFHPPDGTQCNTGGELTCGGEDELDAMKQLCKPLPGGRAPAGLLPNHGQCPNVPALIHPKGKTCQCAPLKSGGTCDCEDPGPTPSVDPIAPGGGGGGTGGGGSPPDTPDGPPHMCTSGTSGCLTMDSFGQDVTCATKKEDSSSTIKLGSCHDQTDQTEERSIMYYHMAESNDDLEQKHRGTAATIVGFKMYKTNNCTGAETLNRKFQCDGICRQWKVENVTLMTYQCSFNEGGMSAGAIVGIVLGSLVGVVVLGVAVFLLVRFIQRRREESDGSGGLLSLPGGGGNDYHQI